VWREFRLSPDLPAGRSDLYLLCLFSEVACPPVQGYGELQYLLHCERVARHPPGHARQVSPS
jgi:hypothetical protein